MVRAFQRTPADYISAIQLVVTASNFVIGAMIGSYIEVPINKQLTQAFPDFAYTSQLSWFLSIGLITVVALIFTNVLPKQIGFVRANEIALQFAPVMRAWIKISRPAMAVLGKITKLTARALHIAPDEKYRVTEKDIDVMLVEGTRAGSIDPIEQAMMRRSMRLSDTLICDVMVPRDAIKWIDAAWSPEEIDNFLRGSTQSNYPVSGGSLEPVLGVLRTQDYFKHRDLGAVMKPVVTAKRSDNLVTALELLRPASTRLLLIMDGGRSLAS